MKIVNCKLKITKTLCLLTIVLLVAIALTPSFVEARSYNCGESQDNPATSENDTEPCTGIVPCTGIDCSLCDLFSLTQNIFNFVVWDIVPVLAIVMIIWSGYVFLTAGAIPANVAKGRKMIASTVIGIAIVYSSYLGASFLIREIAGTTSTASSSFQGNKFLIQCESNPIPDVTQQFLKDGGYSFQVKDEFLLVEEEPSPEPVPEIQQSSESLGEVNGADIQVKINPEETLDGVHGDVLGALKTAVKQAKDNGLNFVVTSGFRDKDSQDLLVAQNCQKDADGSYGAKCNPKAGHAITCIPKDTNKDKIDGGNCRHTTGEAIDLWGYKDGSKDQRSTIQIMQSNGFCYYNRERWHFELKSSLEKNSDRRRVFICSGDQSN